MILKLRLHRGMRLEVCRSANSKPWFNTSGIIAHFIKSVSRRPISHKFVKIAKTESFSPPEPIMYDNNVYDAIYFLKRAMEQMGVTNNPGKVAQDREKIMNGLSTIKDFKGLVGPIAFNADGDADKPILGPR